MTAEYQIQTTQSVEAVLSRVACAAFPEGWQLWEVLPCDVPGAAGWLVRCTFRRPDRDTGRLGIGYGRWWHVPRPATESSVVKTAWLAVQQVNAHETMEHFRYDGARIFDPHNTVAQLATIQEGRRR